MRHACGRVAAAVLALVGAVAGAPAPPPAPAAPEDLARLVPPSATVLVRLTGLADVWQEAKTGAFCEAVRKTEAWKKFAASDEYVRILNARTEMEKRHQFDLEAAVLDTLGTEVVVAQAMEPQPAGGARPAFHLLAARAASAERLKAVADKVRAIGTDTGELKRSVEHAYRGYVVFEEVSVPAQGPHAGRERPSAYCLAGALLLASDRPGPVKAAIDRLLDPAVPSLATSPRYVEALEGLPKGCRVTVFVDAAALAAAGRPEGAEAPGAAPPEKGWIARWHRQLAKSGDTVALGLRLTPAPQVFARVRMDVAKLDPGVAALLQGRPSAHVAWNFLPPSTVLATTRKVDVKKTMEVARQGLPPRAAGWVDAVQQGIGGALGGLDLERDVLPHLGPEVALVVTRVAVPPEAPKDGNVRGLAATLLVQASDENQVATRLVTVLGTLGLLAVTGNNKNPAMPRMSLGVERVGDVAVTYVDLGEGHALRGVVSPCCAKVGPFVAVSTSRQAMRDVIQAWAAGGLAATGAFRRHLDLTGGKADRFAYVNLQHLAAALEDNRAVLVARREAGKTAEAADHDVSTLAEVLRLFDGLSGMVTLAPEAMSATVTLLPARR